MSKVKASLRKELINRRISLNPSLKSDLDSQIARNLGDLPPLQSAKSLMVFYPIKGEPDLRPLYRRWIAEGKDLFLPRVEGSEIVPVRVTSFENLRRGSFGIPEPEGEPVNPEVIDAVLVPGVAFDRKGFRLGFGKGFYDRFLKDLRALKVGVAYSFQILSEIPAQRWDVPVDLIVTDKEIVGGMESWN